MKGERMSNLHSEMPIDGDAELSTTMTVPRTTRRSALRHAGSRRDLRADAREEARLARGRDVFVWRGRVLPIGVPLGAAAGLAVWRRRRSGGEALAAALLTTALTYFGARVEYELRRTAYGRRRAADPVRDD
jgi:hypothetical protein